MASPIPMPSILVVKNLSVTADSGLPAVDSISFEVSRGKIVGIAGVDGNGQTELIDAITGLRKIASGHTSFEEAFRATADAEGAP